MRRWLLVLACLGPPFVLAVAIGYLSSGGRHGDPVAYLSDMALHGVGAGVVLGVGWGAHRGIVRRTGGWSSRLLAVVAVPLLGGLAYAVGYAIETAADPWAGSISASDGAGLWALAAVFGAVPGWLALVVTSPIVARLPASSPDDDSP